MNKWMLWLSVAGVGIAGVAASAEASTVPVVDTSYTVSSAGALSVNVLNLTAPGTVTVSLSNAPWPAPLASVSFELETASGKVLASMSGFGTQTFSIQSAGSLYALVYGVAAPGPGGALGYGSYGLSMSLAPGSSPVALPGAGWLMVSGLAAVAMLRRRQGSVTSDRRLIAINM